MLRDGWNAQNDIGIKLEGIAAKKLRIQDPIAIYHTIFSASIIVGYSFIEVMICIIRMDTNYSNTNDEIEEFISRISLYCGKSIREIGDQQSQMFLDEFISIHDALATVKENV